MKRVEKHGITYKTYRITCDYCDCVFIYNKTDIEGSVDRPLIKCPECGTSCEHYDADVIKEDED